MSTTPPNDDDLMLATAQFLVQALDLTDRAEDIAADLSPMKRDANAAISSIQLDTSIGLAGFLVYTYILNRVGGEGKTGQELFDSGLETLQLAASRNTPGPRPVAHAATDDHGFILATAPGTWRALMGHTPTSNIEAQPDDALTTANTEQIREEAASQLFDLLRQANAQATTWLNALQAASRQAHEDGTDPMIAFTDAETELALFLLDEDSVGALLRTMNLMVATAQEQAAEAMGADDPEATWPTA
ncbi:MAG: hypothetical protein M9934_00710 [Thermomicrobiales bacterium]|nr:hypothetical protein [Thermomicrobiales bacterium]MCO5217490.1 hypothetical protein [Thermomicrobiales bacterium]MCO5226785.1 hypothetical protein [Thermomicrobiales bacterium]